MTIKDIIAINQLFDTGRVVNDGSLAFALEQANQEKSWLKATALVVRAVLIDHVFEEGNKRTAAAVIMAAFEQQGCSFQRDVVTRGVTTILKKNITSIEKIQQVIKYAIRT